MSKIKPKTNRQKLAALVRNASEMDLVFIIERLEHVCDQYADADAVKKAWDPRCMVHPDVYIQAARRTKEAIV